MPTHGAGFQPCGAFPVSTWAPGQAGMDRAVGVPGVGSVSCISPAFDRRVFVPPAIGYFRAKACLNSSGLALFALVRG